MSHSRAEAIFEKLLEIDPTLQDNRKTAMEIIDKLLEEKPETEFDSAFAADLKAKLLSEITVNTKESPKENVSSESFGAKVAKFLKNRTFLTITSLTLASVAIFGAWYVYDLRTWVPDVLAGNWSFEYRKIPYDVPSIDLTLSREIDAKTVTPASVKIFPVVQGVPEVKNGNVISFKLAEKLKIGEHYTLELTGDISSAYGVKMGKSKFFEFEATPGAKVTKVIPEWSGAAINKPIIAFFSIPMIPLESLAKKDTLPCPITIEPATEGKCRWLSSSVVQFDPKTALLASNAYKIKVSNIPGFLYPLSQEYTGEFSTTRLVFLSRLLSDDLARDADTPREYYDESVQKFSITKGIPLRFSSSVKKDDLAKSLKITNASGAVMPFTLVGVAAPDVSAAWRVLPADGTFSYNAGYKVEIAAGLPAAGGNLPLEKEASLTMYSMSLLSSPVGTVRETYSATGGVTDSRYMEQGKLALQNASISLTFSEEVNLPKNSIYLQAGETTVPCELTYGSTWVTKPNGESKQEMSKKQVECRIKRELVPNTEYNLVITEAVSAGLKTPYKTSLTTPKLPTIDTNTHLVSNTELCVYSSVPLEYSSGAIKLTPDSPVRDIRKDGDGFWNPYKDMYDSSLHCPVRDGFVANVVGVRMAPKTKYSVEFTPKLKSIYGDALVASVASAVTSGDILPQDKYVYSPLSRNLNVVPADVPLVNAFQTVNADTLKISVCEMDISGYSHYLDSQYEPSYEPKCINQAEKDVSVKNLAWNMSTSKFDIEKEILGHPITTPFVLVRSSVMGKFHSLYGKNDPDRETINMFIRSNISLVLEKAGNGGLIFATSFDGRQLKDNLTFTFFEKKFDGALAEMSGLSVKWNQANKSYDISGADKLLARAAFAVATGKDGEHGVMALSNDQFQNYDFGYNSGMDSSTRDFAYVYTDRPIYRAGDAVSFKGLLRTFEPKWYKKSSAQAVSAKILDEEGNLFKEITLSVDKNANFSGNFTIPKESKSGRLHFDIYTAKNKNELSQGAYVYNDAYFYIEAYKKPTFRAGVGIDKTDVTLGDTLKVQISPTYYFGGKLASTSYQYTVGSQSYFFDAKDYSDYQFGEGYGRFECLYWGQCGFKDSLSAVSNGEIGANGNGQFDFALPQNEKSSNGEDLAEKVYTFNVDVRDPDTAKTVTESVSSVLHTTDGYVGIKLPYWIAKNTDIAGNGVLLGWGAAPKSGDISLEFIKQEWKMVKKQGVDGAFYSEYGLEETSEAKTTVSADKDGKFAISYTPKGQGEYKVKASYTGKNGKAYVSSSTVYIDSDSYIAWDTPNNSTTEISVEKTLLNVGETAKLTVKSPVKSGNMFVSLEKDDAILKSFVMPIDSYSPHIEIPITEEHLPNLYVKVFIIGKDAGMQLPVYKRGLAVLKVSTASKKLSVDIKADKQNYLPGSPATIAVLVTDALGHPVKNANGSLSIVDESVLALMGNPQKNPFAFFYDMKRYLGVETVASLAYLIEKLEVKNIGNGEKGGAGDSVKWGDAKKKRGVFKDTAFWLSDFTTDENGKALVKVSALPDNLTTWVVESIVSTSQDNQIGIASTKLSTNKTVMISENLPRFFRSGDKVTLAPVVFNRTGKESDFTVSLKSDALSVSDATQTVHLRDGESRAVPFEVTPKSSGPLSASAGVKLSLEAKSETTGELDALEYTLPLENSDLYETVTTIGSTKDNSYDEKIDLTGTLKNNGLFSVRFGATPFAFLTDGMDYLSNYPYGCAEQKSSAVAPNIAMKKLFDAANLPFDLEKKMVKKYIDREEGYRDASLAETLRDYLVSIKSHTKMGGGIGYWADSEYADFSVSSLVLSTVADLESIGIKADTKWKNELMEYLKTRFYANYREGCSSSNPKYCEYSEESRLSAVSALLAAGASVAETDKMLNVLDKAKLTPLQNLAYARVLAREYDVLGKAGKPTREISDKLTPIVQNTLKTYLVYNPRGAFISIVGSESRTEATALFTEILSIDKSAISGADEILDNLSRFLASEKKKDGGFGSTRDTAAVVRAVVTFLVKNPNIQKTNMVAKAILNSESLLEKPIGKTELFTPFSTSVALNTVPDTSTLHFEKNGEGKLYYEVAMKYAIPAKDQIARDEGFLVETEYYDYNEYRTLSEKKKQEWEQYGLGNISYESLKYPLDAASYLTPLTSYKVGQLVYVRVHILTPEVRDRVAFESFIPAGSELVNTNLSTETKVNMDEKVFDHEEFRDDRYFGYTETLEPGEYVSSYAIRMTHAGKYSVLPSSAFEFDHNEVFGRGNGREIMIKK